MYQYEHSCGEPVERADGICPNCQQLVTPENIHEAGARPPADLQSFLDPFDADGFIKHHRCSACWGILVKRMKRDDQGKRRYRCECEVCGWHTPGYVSATYVQRRFESNRAEAAAAKHALRDAIPWMKSKKTEEQILAELYQ